MDDGLSHRPAAKVAGVSKTAIGKAIEAGHLAALATGKVTAAALHKWMDGRRAPRGNQSSAPVAAPATAAATTIAAFMAGETRRQAISDLS